MNRTRRARLLAAVTVGLSVPAIGQTFLAGNGSFSDPAKWSPAPPDNSVFASLLFAGGNYTSLNDLPGDTFFNTGSLTSGAVALNAGSLSSTTLKSLETANASLTINSFLAADSLRTVGTGAIAVNAPLMTTGLLTLNGSGGSGTITLAREVYAAAQISLGGGTLVIASPAALCGRGTPALVLGGALASTIAALPAGATNLSPTLPTNLSLAPTGAVFGGANGFAVPNLIANNAALTIRPNNALDQTWIVAGNSAGTFTTLTVDATAATGNVTALLNGTNLSAATIALNGPAQNARVAFSASTPRTISSALNLGTLGGGLGAINGATETQIDYAGSIAGSGPLVRFGTGSMNLSGTNTGLTGGLILSGGLTRVNTDANLGAANTSLTFNGGELILASPITTARPYVIGSSLIAPTITNTLHTLADATLTTALTGQPNSAFIKAGPGALTLTASSAFAGSLTINGGTLVLAGAAGAVGNATMAFNNSTLVVDNTTAFVGNRLPAGTSTLSLNGSSIRVIGNAASATLVGNSSATLSIGSSNFGGTGPVDITLVPGASANVRLTTRAPTRFGNNGTFLRFAGAGLGANTFTASFAGASNILFNATPTLANGVFSYAVADASPRRQLAGICGVFHQQRRFPLRRLRRRSQRRLDERRRRLVHRHHQRRKRHGDLHRRHQSHRRHDRPFRRIARPHQRPTAHHRPDDHPRHSVERRHRHLPQRARDEGFERRPHAQYLFCRRRNDLLEHLLLHSRQRPDRRRDQGRPGYADVFRRDLRRTDPRPPRHFTPGHVDRVQHRHLSALSLAGRDV